MQVMQLAAYIPSYAPAATLHVRSAHDLEADEFDACNSLCALVSPARA